MQWRLGKSAAIRQQSLLEVRLTTAALYALALMPLLLIFSRVGADIAGSFIAGLFLLRSAKCHDWQWLKQPLMRVAFILWIYSLVAVSPMALDPSLSFGRAVTWVRFIVFLGAMAYWLSAYRDELLCVARWLSIILVFVIVDSLMQYATGQSLIGFARPDGRLSGPFNKVVVGIYLAKMSFPVLGAWLYYSLQTRNRWQVMCCVVFLSLDAATIMLSNERTAIITFLLGFGLAGVLLFSAKFMRKTVLVMGIIIAVLIVGLYTTQPVLIDRASSSQQQLHEGFWSSPYGQLWMASFAIWKQYPFLGAGMMNFRVACLALMEENVVSYCNLHSHNPYLEWLSELGGLGLLGFLVFLGCLVSAMFPRVTALKRETVVPRAFAFATFVPSFFPLGATQSMFSNWPAWLLWFSIGLALAQARSMAYES